MPSESPVAPLYTRTFWHACSIHFTGAMAQSMFILFPLYVRHLGGNELTIGALAGTASAAAVAIRWPVGRGLDRLGRRRILFIASGLQAIAWMLLLLTNAIDTT